MVNPVLISSLECGNGGIIQNRITDALLHPHVGSEARDGIYANDGDTASSEVAAARFVGVIRPRRTEREDFPVTHRPNACLRRSPDGREVGVVLIGPGLLR